MILDVEVTDEMLKNPVLKLLHESEYIFYLTGSRFMNQQRLDSDWDFVAEESTEVLKFLNDNQFVRMKGKYDNADLVILPTDDEMEEDNDFGGFTRQVLENKTQPNVIQVQITRVVQAKRFARNTIDAYLKHKHVDMDGFERRKLWNYLIRAYLITDPNELALQEANLLEEEPVEELHLEDLPF